MGGGEEGGYYLRAGVIWPRRGFYEHYQTWSLRRVKRFALLVTRSMLLVRGTARSLA